MFDLHDSTQTPTIHDFSSYIRNDTFDTFIEDMKETYACIPHMDFSKCSWEYGWNIKFKKYGKTLCTVYPREQFFTVMIVIGKNEKPPLEKQLPYLTSTVQEVYHSTTEGNGQRWLMIDVEDKDNVYQDIWKLLKIRTGK